MHALTSDDPRRLGGCHLLARIGSGGMATVYFGRSEGGRAVAVKVMHADHARDRAERDRFRREVAAAQAVRSRYVPPVVAADPDARTPWLATEFVPAMSLHEAVSAIGALPTRAVWPLAAGLVAALADIHRAGVVHLDLKPGNVLLTAGVPRVVDFGIARQLAGGMLVRSTAAGSRGYMSPEQVSDVWIGPPSDVYSLGATLAYACTGHHPADGQPPPRNATGDEALYRLIAKCLHRDPASRPTLDDLTRIVTEAMAAQRFDTRGLPRKVAAEVRRRANEAGNPPVPSTAAADLPEEEPRRLLSRRALVIGGVGAVAVAAVGGGAQVAGEDTAGKWMKPPRPAPASPPPTRPLEVLFTGDAVLASLTVAVNGEPTTLTDVRLPWRKTFDVPVAPERSTWQLTYRFFRGEVRYRVTVADVLVMSGNTSSTNGRFDKYVDGIA